MSMIMEHVHVNERQGEPSLIQSEQSLDHSLVGEESIVESHEPSINQSNNQSNNHVVKIFQNGIDYSDLDLPPLPALPDQSISQPINQSIDYQSDEESDYESDDEPCMPIMVNQPFNQIIHHSNNQSIDLSADHNQSISVLPDPEDLPESNQSIDEAINQSVCVLPDDDDEDDHSNGLSINLPVVDPSIQQSINPSPPIDHSVNKSNNLIPNELNLSYNDSGDDSPYPLSSINQSSNHSIDQSSSPAVLNRFPTHQSFNLSIYRTNQSMNQSNFNTATSSDFRQFDPSPRSSNQSNNQMINPSNNLAVFDVRYDEDDEEKYEYKESQNQSNNQSNISSFNRSLQSPMSHQSVRSEVEGIGGTTVLIGGTINEADDQSMNQTINQPFDQTGTTIMTDNGQTLINQTINQSINYTTEISSSVRYAPSNYATINQSINQSMCSSPHLHPDRASSEPARLSYSHQSLTQSINQSINHTDIAHHRHGSESYIYQTFLPLNQSINPTINQTINETVNQSIHEHGEIKEGETEWTDDEPGLLLSINQSINQIEHADYPHQNNQVINQSIDQTIKDQPNYQYNPHDWEVEGIEMSNLDENYLVNQSKEGAVAPANRSSKQSKRRSVNRSRKRSVSQSIYYWPWFTVILSIVQIVMFLVMMSSSGWTIDSLTINPLFGPDAKSIIQYGGKFTPLISRLTNPTDEQWRLFSNLFLNGSVIQLITSLALIGQSYHYERRHGCIKLFAIWLVSGVFGQLLSNFFTPRYVSCGASATLLCFAAIGIVDAVYENQAIKQAIENSIRQSGRNAAVNRSIPPSNNQSIKHALLRHIPGIVIGFITFIFPYMDGWAMIGSFLCGILMSIIVLAPMQLIKRAVDQSINRSVTALLVCCVLIVCGAYAVIGVALFISNNLYSDWCPGCYWAGCLDIGTWTCYPGVPESCFTGETGDANTQGWC